MFKEAQKILLALSISVLLTLPRGTAMHIIVRLLTNWLFELTSLFIRAHTRQLIFRMTIVITACTIASGAIAKPTIAHITDPVSPGDTIMIIGTDLQNINNVSLRRLTNDAFKSSVESSTGIKLDISFQDSNAIAAPIPDIVLPGAYEVEISDGSKSQNILINTPTIYWIQGDRGADASKGGLISIFGRNIARTSAAMIELSSKKTMASFLIKATTAGLWQAEFVIPAMIPEGAYSIRLWNGSGDARSWSQGGEINLVSLDTWPPLRKHIDHRDMSVLDYSSLIQNALDSFHGATGQVLIEDGYYNLTRTIKIPANASLIGSSTEAVRLIWADTPNPANCLIDGDTDFRLANFTLVAGNHGHVICGGFSSSPNPKNISLEKIRIRANSYRGHLSPQEMFNRYQASLTYSSGGPDTIRIKGNNTVIHDCDVFGSGRSLFLSSPQFANISNNTFYNGRLGWYSITNPHGVIFRENKILGGDLQSTGGGINTLSVDNARSEDVIFFNNSFTRLDGWDREAMTSDGPGGCYSGGASSNSGDALTLHLRDLKNTTALQQQICKAESVFVVDGRGIGLYRSISTIRGDEVVLSSPLGIQLDASSEIVISPLQRNYLVIDNSFVDVGAAIQFYGVAVDHVVSGNTLVRSAGINSVGLNYSGDQPNWYVQILGNSILEDDVFGASTIAVYGGRIRKSMTPLTMGAVMRKNILSSHSVLSAGFPIPGLKYIVDERNSFLPGPGCVIETAAGEKGIISRLNGGIGSDCKVKH